ncbi:MAG: transcriptional regulator GcvA [Thiomonas sp.]
MACANNWRRNFIAKSNRLAYIKATGGCVHKLLFLCDISFSKSKMKFLPLHALRCFECAGRRSSIKEAAQELHITPAAVSQQISKLESRLGVQLFVRSVRRITLTDEGQRYLQSIRSAFRLIDDATQALTGKMGPLTITVSCTVGFAMQWLLPRLSSWEVLAPDVEVRISTGNRLVHLGADGIDFAVRHGLGRYEGLTAECLIDDQLQPVCSPELQGGMQGAITIEDLRNFTLLHDEHRLDWALWLQAVGAQDGDGNRGPVFVNSNGVIEAAIAGRGIALVRESLVKEELTNRRLVMPFGTKIKSGIAYYLVYEPTTLAQAHHQRFRDWIHKEAADGMGLQSHR